MVPGFAERDARAAALQRHDLFRLIEAERTRPRRPGRNAILRRAWSARLTATLTRATAPFTAARAPRPNTRPA